MTTTKPLAANSSGFQRYDQSSPQAPSGPPWMRNFTGYFLEASKLGGLTRNPSTLSSWAPVNQKDWSGDMRIWDKTGSFRWVSRFGPSQVAGTAFPWICAQLNAGSPWVELNQSGSTGRLEMPLGPSRDISVKTSVLPSGVKAGSSLKPSTSALRLGDTEDEGRSPSGEAT